MYSFTIFKNIYDNKTHKRMDFKTLDKFESFFYELSKIERKGKKDAQLISPAVYESGSTRRNNTVLNWASWCAVDVDDHAYINERLKDDLVSDFGKYWFLCYSTASSTSAQPKFRLVFPLKSPVESDNIRKFWYALNTELGSIGDRQTKDLSRMYYIPGRYATADNFYFTNRTDHIMDPDTLINKHPMPEKKGNFLDGLPEEFREKLIAHRKSQMENTSITWTNYHDCPFFPKKLAAEYQTINNTGWYHKMFQIMIAIAGQAIKKEYPITPHEIADLCSQLDAETGGWYKDRPLEKEAERAIEYAYTNFI